MKFQKKALVACLVFVTSVIGLPDQSDALDAKTYAKLGRLKAQYRDSASLVGDPEKKIGRTIPQDCGNLNVGTLQTSRSRNANIEVFVDGDIVNAARCR